MKRCSGCHGNNVETMCAAISYLESPPARKALSRKAA